MNSLTCPFCDSVFPLIDATYQKRQLLFHYDRPENDYCFMAHMFRCPSCGKVSSFAVGTGSETSEITKWLYPISTAKHFPEYVPETIRNDYEEAYAIVSLSPKASATLSRRCLQGMIHHFWGIKEKNLNAEITSLKGKIDAGQWSAIDALRKIGNIGAHMENDINLIVDIDHHEAEQLLHLIELLVKEWYIARHERDELLNGISSIGTLKETLRKGNP